jgi:subtilase family serine protease
MQYQCKTKVRDFPDQMIGWRRLRNRLLGGLAFGWLLLPSSALFAQKVTVELSPLVARSSVVSPMDPQTQISVALVLPLSDAKGAADLVRRLSDRNDPNYKKFLTPQEFAARYGGNAEDFATLKEWAATNGLTVVHESLARTILTVRGSVQRFQELFTTQLNNYRGPDGREFYSAVSRPTVPDAIASKVTGVIGLTNSIQTAPLAKVYKRFGENPVASADHPEIGGTGPGGTYSASDLRNLYLIPNFGGVAPETVAIFEQGGFHASDVKKYLQTMKLPDRPVKVIGVDGYDGQVNGTSVELEAVLDIDMVIGINPDVHEVLVYEDGNDVFPVALLDALDQVATDNKAQVLSISYGQDEYLEGDTAMEAENATLTQLGIQGVSVFASAGDNGAYGDTGSEFYPAHLNVIDPGSQPLLTCVGGTSLYAGAHQTFLGEVVWNDLGINDGATGGGVSSYWAIPDYQFLVDTTRNGGSGTMRNVPDVAAVGDPETGVAVYSKINGGWIQIGGTSVSAPIWAGYASILNAGCEYLGEAKIGQLNNFAYFTLLYPPLYAVNNGTNGSLPLFGTPGYSAGFHYNNCTGNGSLEGGGFAFQVINMNWVGASGPISIKVTDVTDSSITVTWTKSKGSDGYVLLLGVGTDDSHRQTFVTKDTKFVFTNLPAQTTGYVVVQSMPGFYAPQNVDFKTK